MKKQLTIKDLAGKLNLHHTTVSRALRNHPDVNEKTRQAVIKAARKYNYVPNSFAKSLRSARNRIIVVMVPQIKNFFFSEVLSVISDQAFREGYSVMIYQSNEDGGMELQNLDAIMEYRVAGIIASVANAEGNNEKYLQLERLGIPVVLFDRSFANDNFSKVIINNYGGAFDATDYLLGSGRKRIGFYRGVPGNPVFDERFQGYIGALKERGLTPDNDLIYPGGIDMEDGIRLVKKIHSNHMRIDALLCSVDMVALGVIAGARELGIRIPDDLALIGFDNEPAGRIIRPALTTVAQPVYRIGVAAFDLLLSRINRQKNDPAYEILLDMELLVRTSA